MAVVVLLAFELQGRVRGAERGGGVGGEGEVDGEQGVQGGGRFGGGEVAVVAGFEGGED